MVKSGIEIDCSQCLCSSFSLTCPASVSSSIPTSDFIIFPITTTLVSYIQQALSIISVNEAHHLGLLIIVSLSSPNLPLFHCYSYNLGLCYYYFNAGFQISTSLKKLYRPYKTYHLEITLLFSKQ